MAQKRKLIWAIYPSYLLIIFVSMLAVTWYASSSARKIFLKQTLTDLESNAHLFENQIIPYLEPLNEEKIDELCKKAGNRSSIRITVILPSGRVAGDSESDPGKMDNHIDRQEFRGAISEATGTSIRYSRTMTRNYMYLGIPVKINEELKAVLRTSIPVDLIDQELYQVQRSIMYGGLIIALLGAMVSLYISRRIVKPIEALKNSAELFIKGDFDHRIPASDIEELSSLDEAIKDMAHKLHRRINTIARQRSETNAILSSMVEGVVAVDMDERIITMNRSAAEMLGVDFEVVKNQSVQEIVRNSTFLDFLKETMSSLGPVEKELNLSVMEGLIVNGHGTDIRDEHGKQIGALIVLNDITRLKRLENIRTEFVANVSHEIKTPITAIKGFVEILNDESVKEKEDTKRFLGIIAKHVSRLEAIIDDLLKLSRIEREAESEGIELVEKKILDVIQTAIQLCEPAAQIKGIKTGIDCDENLAAKINPPLLEQAIVNLIDNAIKYSDNESLINIRGFQDEKGVTIEVTDHGRGIEEEHLSRLFERFYRVDKARSRRLGGTGLGLAIVKHIVQAHGGSVSVKSTPGAGSTFSLHIA